MIFLKNEQLYHETQIRVRYAETDKMGYSYYGNYPTYYEVGRTEFLREMGLTYKSLEDDGYLLPIVSMSVKYIKPAVYDDLLTVRTYYKKIHSVKVDFDYEIFNQNNILINTGTTLLAFVDINTRKPTQAPDIYLETLKKIWKKNK
ncbi:MAG: thioesterase family protein [Bacteroidota bacterium]|nr:thioesterase family protein [Bacteroidota bacterium]